MKLLNLWPATRNTQKTISPKRRLLQETLLMLLLVVLALSAIYVYWVWKTQNITTINTALNTHVQSLNDQEQNDAHTMAYLTLRTKNTGQLNWLVALFQLTDQHVQFTRVVQKDNGLLMTGQADQVEATQALLAQMNLYFSKTVVQSLESKADHGVTSWQFVIQTNMLGQKE